MLGCGPAPFPLNYALPRAFELVEFAQQLPLTVLKPELEADSAALSSSLGLALELRAKLKDALGIRWFAL